MIAMIIVVTVVLISCAFLLLLLKSAPPSIPIVVNKKEFMTMVNNGKDPCDYTTEIFKCGDYTSSFDLYIKKEK